MVATLSISIALLFLGYIGLPLTLLLRSRASGLGFFLLIDSYICCYPLFSILAGFGILRYPRSLRVRILSIVLAILSVSGFLLLCLTGAVIDRLR